MSNTVLTKVLAAVTILFYVAATVGFDIHTDSEHGRTYIHSLLSDLSCESIHPDTPCCHHHDGECGCEDRGCEDDEDCCSDDSEQLDAPGLVSHHAFINTDFTVIPATPSMEPAPAICRKANSNADICKGPPRSLLSKNCILRV